MLLMEKSAIDPASTAASIKRAACVVVSPKAVKSMARRHPWIFSGAVQKVNARCEPGETVLIQSREGRPLAWGAFSPHSQIRVRVWSYDPFRTIDDLFFKNRLEEAIARRCHLPLPVPCTARRLVNAESDGLPGLVVDQYGDYLICQFLAAGVEARKTAIVAALAELTHAKGIYERSDAEVRAKEGLAEQMGPLWGQPPPESIDISVGEVRLWVDVRNGHKTGFYLDQRENHGQAARYAADAQVLNCFSYSGAFGIRALKAGACHVTNIDASQTALELSKANLTLNKLPDNRCDHICGNAFEILRQYRDAGRRFDLIILDPPKFVASAGQLARGSRGYKDINLLGFKLLRPGGILVTFSCSGLVTSSLFQKIVADAALDAGRHAQILDRLSQSADHPVALNFPEGLYLKGLICRVD
jgi:23S rRNA (cytosine1962-C5)-methyltransferase